MISAKYRHKFNPLWRGIAKLFVKAGIGPNAVTLFSLVLAGITVYFLAKGDFLLGGILLLITAGFDALDGAVARLSGKESAFGSYLDAVVDRYVEAILIIGIAFATGFWFLCIVLLFGSLATSYNKARAAMAARIDNNAWPDLLERGERLFLLGLGVGLSALFSGYFGQNALIYWVLAALALLTNLTAVQRVFRAKGVIK